MSKSSNSRLPLCPSAHPNWEGSVVIIGVVGGTPDAPDTVYFKTPEPISDELLALASPVSPAEVFRFSAPCACTNCMNYADKESKCRLAEKVVRWVPKVVSKLPACSIRADCRWWLQEGQAACQRCPQVVTLNIHPTEEMRHAADPQVE